MTNIKFGTDGWRGVIAEDYTYENVRKVAHAIARYVIRGANPEHGILVGYDTRFGSEHFARVAAEAVSATGTPVWLAAEACSHARPLVARAPARRIRRNSNHREPQSVSLERNKVQGQLRKFGIACDRGANRSRNLPRCCVTACLRFRRARN